MEYDTLNAICSNNETINCYDIYDDNGYGRIQYSITSPFEYDNSIVKNVLDQWLINVNSNNDILSVRILKIEDLRDSLDVELVEKNANSHVLKIADNTVLPNWLTLSFNYWVETYDGNVYCMLSSLNDCSPYYGGYGRSNSDHYMIRPVIVLSKSAL